MRQAVARMGLFFAAAASCSRAIAADAAANAPAFQVPAPNFSAGTMLPGLLLFLVIAGGGLYLLKNGIPAGWKKRTTGRKLEISEMRSLGNRQFLVVVEYEDNKMLLGVAPGKIDYLCAIESRPAADFSSLVSPAATVGQTSSES